MKGKRFWALSLSAVLAVSMLSGCIRPQVTEDMIPTVTDLGMSEEAAPVEEEVRVVGLSMNKSYMAELTRMDGDNTQAAAVDAKAIPVVLKATSMDKDLKGEAGTTDGNIWMHYGRAFKRKYASGKPERIGTL